MNIQTINCQPIRPVYQLNSKPSFGHDEDFCSEDIMENDFLDLEQERTDLERLAQNKDSKFLSSVGTLGLGIAAGAASFLTFKTMAPKGAQTLKSIYAKVANFKYTQKATNFVKKYVNIGLDKAKNVLNGINPESKLGKIKNYLSDKIGSAYSKVKSKVVDFAQKHKIDRAAVGNTANNVGGVLVAVPAATTAINASLENKNDGGIE